MNDNHLIILNLFIYILLIPVIFKVLLAIRIEEIFKKGKTREIMVFYFLITIALAKLTGDFLFFLLTFIYDLK